MKNPKISNYYKSRKVSVIRSVYEKLNERTDQIVVIDAALGNVSLPMHPALIKRMKKLNSDNSPFRDGIVKYSPAAGFIETKEAFLNILKSSNFPIKDLLVQVTDGASQAIEFCLLGISDGDKSTTRPVLLIDPAYTSYEYMARRLNRQTVSIARKIRPNGQFEFPSIIKLEKIIKKSKPCAVIVIPYDNPTGQMITYKHLENLAKLCVKYGMWMVSDETYRELHYLKTPPVSIWGLTEEGVPGVRGRRISIESASKVWNACGLRIGAIITDNKEFAEKASAESTANVCPNVIGQYIFAALAEEKKSDLKIWFKKQRDYYSKLIYSTSSRIKKEIPKVIISKPESSLYSVIDFKGISSEFNALDFINFCAKSGKVAYEGRQYTLLMTPLANFYKDTGLGKTMVRLSYVDIPNKIKLIPMVLKGLLQQYISKI